MKLIKYIKNHKLISFLTLLAIIFIPILLIHVLFSIHSEDDWWIAKWSAGELLDYFGSIMGAVATIVALVVTITYTNENQKKQNILSVKPYLQSNYKPIFDYTDIFSNYPDKILYITFGKNISSCTKVPLFFENMRIENSNRDEFFKKFHIIKYTLKNVGADNATNIKWTLNNNPVIPEFTVSKEEVKEFIIAIDSLILENDEKILELMYTYNNIFSLASYSQREIIRFVKDSCGLTTMQKPEHLISPPKRIQ